MRYFVSGWAFHLVLMLGCGLALIGCQSSSTSVASPQQMLNDVTGVLYTADGQLRAPIDAAEPTNAPPEGFTLEQVKTRLADSPLKSPRPELDSQGKGVLSEDDSGEGVLRVMCDEFNPDAMRFQEREDICWAACVQMLDAYQLRRLREQAEILESVMGPGLENVPVGQNLGNLYEIIKALNPQAISDEGQTDYLALQALALTEGDTEFAVRSGLRQVQRYMHHFVGTEDMLAALARGEPIIVGMMLPSPYEPGKEFGHAMVLYGAQFTAIMPEASTERDFLKLESQLQTTMTTYDLVDADEPEGMTAAESFTHGWNKVKGGLQGAYEMVGGSEIDRRPYWLAITHVWLADPLGDPEEADNPFEEVREMSGEEFRDRLLYALTYRVAREVSPVADEEQVQEVAEELGS